VQMHSRLKRIIRYPSQIFSCMSTTRWWNREGWGRTI